MFRETKDDGLKPFGLISGNQPEMTEFEMIQFYENVDDYLKYDTDFFDIEDIITDNINPTMRAGRHLSDLENEEILYCKEHHNFVQVKEVLYEENGTSETVLCSHIKERPRDRETKDDPPQVWEPIVQICKDNLKSSVNLLVTVIDQISFGDDKILDGLKGTMPQQ